MALGDRSVGERRLRVVVSVSDCARLEYPGFVRRDHDTAAGIHDSIVAGLGSGKNKQKRTTFPAP